MKLLVLIALLVAVVSAVETTRTGSNLRAARALDGVYSDDETGDDQYADDDMDATDDDQYDDDEWDVDDDAMLEMMEEGDGQDWDEALGDGDDMTDDEYDDDEYDDDEYDDDEYDNDFADEEEELWEEEGDESDGVEEGS
jgi:hypothetical protein